MPCYFIGTLSQTLTLRAAFASSTYLLSQIPGPGRSSDDDLLNPPDPVFKGAIRAYGLSIAACLPCSPTPARHLMTYLNPPNPLFKGAHQAFVRTRARDHRFAVLRPASDDALLFYWDSVPNYLNSPDPLFKGAIRAYGLSIAACLPCSPTPARHLMTTC